MLVVIFVFAGVIAGFYLGRQTAYAPVTKNEIKPTGVTLPTLSPITSSSGNITVSEPKQNQTLLKPFIIKGEANVFENQLHYRIHDTDGSVLQQGQITANGEMGRRNPYEVIVSSFSKPKGNAGTVEIYDIFSKDGSEIDTVVINVKFGK